MQQQRFIPHPSRLPSDFNLRTARREILDAITGGAQRVQRHPSSKPEVYVGAAGMLLMDWRLADLASESGLPAFPASSGHLASSLSRPSSGTHTSFLETSVGIATMFLMQQLRTASTSQQTSGQLSASAKRCVQFIQDAIQIAIGEELDEDGCEVLYGRAGLLYAILRLRSANSALTSPRGANEASLTAAIARLTADATIIALVNDIVERGNVGAESFRLELSGNERALAPPLMWSWHGKRYLGSGHGVAGILQMLVSVPPHILAPHWDLVLQTITWSLELQQRSGNWPSSVRRHWRGVVEEDSELVQWCHGAPGFLILLSTLLRRFDASSPPSGLTLPHALRVAARTALARGAELVYKRGLLRKGVGLCHGVGGSVYALLATSDALDVPVGASAAADEAGTEAWFLRAVHLAQLAMAYESLTRMGEMRVPDHPYSLYEGVAGMCCAWADVVSRIDYVLRVQTEGRSSGLPASLARGMPGYDDLEVLAAGPPIGSD